MNSNNQWLDPLYLDSFLNEDEKLIRENTKKYCQKNLLPNVVKNNRNYYFDKEIYKDFGRMGFLGSTIKGFGSSEINKVSYGLIAFEIESIDSSYRSAISVQSSLVCHPIDKFGSKEQKETYLPDLIKGNLVGCFGLTESEAGSDPSSMKTNFKEFEDHYLINGSKTWITNAPIADIFLIWALNEKKDIKLFLIPKKTKGLKTSTIENKTSLKISPTGQIILDNVKIPKENLLPHTSGWKSVYSCLNNARYGIAWGALGAAETCWFTSRDYVMDRKQFDKPLGSNQIIQLKLADMQTDISIGLQGCFRAGQLMDNNNISPELISLIKRNSTAKALDIARKSRDMLGGNGISDEYPIMRHMVNLEVVNTYEGTSDIHALILGRTQTDIPAF